MKKKAGFTLIEILLAIFIFSIVITLLYSSFNSVFSGSEPIDENIVIEEMAKSCFNRMILDLESIYVSLPPLWVKPERNEFRSEYIDDYKVVGDNYPSYSGGDSNFSRLRFTSFSHIPLNDNFKNQISEIIYYIQSDQDNNRLKRSDKTYPYKEFEENENDPVLCENVKSLKFFYYDQDGNEFDLWDSESDEYEYATPKAIGIELEISKKSVSHIFKTMVTLHVLRQKST